MRGVYQGHRRSWAARSAETTETVISQTKSRSVFQDYYAPAILSNVDGKMLFPTEQVDPTTPFSFLCF